MTPGYVVWGGRVLLMPPPSPPKSGQGSTPLQKFANRSPYRQVLEALRALPASERVDFYEANSALCRSADLDGADGLLSLRNAYCRGSSALDRALTLEWRRQFVSPRLAHPVERDFPQSA